MYDKGKQEIYLLIKPFNTHLQNFQIHIDKIIYADNHSNIKTLIMKKG